MQVNVYCHPGDCCGVSYAYTQPHEDDLEVEDYWEGNNLIVINYNDLPKFDKTGSSRAVWKSSTSNLTYVCFAKFYKNLKVEDYESSTSGPVVRISSDGASLDCVVPDEYYCLWNFYSPSTMYCNIVFDPEAASKLAARLPKQGTVEVILTQRQRPFYRAILLEAGFKEIIHFENPNTGKILTLFLRE